MTGITISRATLLEPLVSVASICPSRSTIPILQSLRIEADNGILQLSGTDMDIWLSREIPIDGKLSPICVEAERFADIVRRFDANAVIKISLDEGRIFTISSGRSKYNIPTLSANDFPAMQEREFTHSFTTQAKTIKEVFGKLLHSVSKDEIRYYLNGIHFFTKEKNICAESTDGHRMTSVLIGRLVEGDFNIIIPAEAAQKTLKLLDIGGDAFMEISDRLIRITVGTAKLQSKLIDGAFPDIDRIVPVDYDGEVQLQREDFIKAAQRLQAFAVKEKIRAIKCTPDNGNLILTSHSNEGDGEEVLEAVIKDNVNAFAVNTAYLLDALSQIEGDAIALRFTENLMRLDDSDNEGDVHIIMKTRL